MAQGGSVVARAWVEIVPEMRGIQGKIAEGLGAPLEKEGRASGKRAGSGFGGAFKGAIAALGGLAAAAGFADLVKEAASATDATQKFKSTLTFAGKASEIDSLVASTRSYADATVYSLADIQNVTAQLAANGVSGYDRLAEAAGNLNAVAGGNAQTFSSVGMVLTQTAGAGKLTTENWNQLADAIPGASGKLQQAMLQNGAYTGNFREAMEKGQISAEEFNQAIMQLGFEDAAVKAAKSTSTFEGAIGNLQASAVGVLSDVLTRMQPAVTGVINGAAEAINTVSSAFASASGPMEALSTVVDAAVASASANLPRMLDLGMALLANLGQGIRQSMPSIVSSALDIVQGMASGFATYFPLLVQSGGNFILSLVQGLMASLPTIIEKAPQIITDFANGFSAGMQTLLGIGLQILVTIAQGIISSIPTLIANIPQIFEAIFAAWQALSWVNLGSGLINFVKSGIQSASGSLVQFVKYVFESIKSSATSIWNGIRSAVTGVANGINGAVTGAFSALSGGVSGIWNGMRSVASSVWNGIKSTIGGVVSGISSAVTGGFNGVKGAVTGIWNGIRSAISGAINGAKGVVQGAIRTIRSVMNFSWALPKLKLPHISIKGSFSLVPPSVPSFGISWYAKGGYFDSPSVIGVGEAGGEFVAPERQLAEFIRGSVARGYAAAQGAPSPDGSDRVIAWLERNLPGIIAEYTPYTGQRALQRQIREAVQFA